MSSHPSAKILILDENPRAKSRYRWMNADRHSVHFETTLPDPADDYDIVFVTTHRPVSVPELHDRLPPATKVGLITDSIPTENIYEQGFDGYLVRPVDREAFETTVRSLLARTRYAELVDEHFAVAKQLAELETNHDDAVLQNNPTYQALRTRLDDLTGAIEDRFDQICAAGSPEGVFYDIQPPTVDAPTSRPAAVN